jgi:hypothetical protein
LQRRLAIALCALGLYAVAAAPAAAHPDAGTESNLGLGAGSRGIALGGACLARLGDASAVFWNPAGLAGLERGELSAMHARLGMGDAGQTFVGLGWPTLRAGSFGLGMLRLATSGIHAYDADSRPLGELEYSETALFFSWAARPRLPGVERGLALGITAKSVTQSLTPWSSTGAGVDLGLVFAPPQWPALALAAVVQDAVTPRLRLDESADAVPRTLRLGASYRVAPQRDLGLEVHLGVDRPGALGWTPRLGLECEYRRQVVLRFGTSRYGTAFGIGLRWGGYGLDYAYLTQAEATTHPVSLSAAWGSSCAERLAAQESRQQAERAEELRAHMQAKIDARHAAAQAAYERGDYAAALDEWKIVAGLDPADERAGRGMQAAGARLAEQQARSQQDASQAAARAAQFALGLRYYGAGEYVLARNVWQQLLAEEPDNAQAQRYLRKTEERLLDQVRHLAEQARSLEQRGDFVSALAEWNQVRSVDALHPEAEPALARCRAALQGANARRRVAQQPSRGVSAAAKYNEALGLYSAGEVERAAGLLREVVRQDAGNTAAAQLLAQAERQLRPLSAEDKARVRELYLRGMSWFTANEFEKAIAEWSKILTLDPGNASVYQNIDEARARLRAIQD